MNVSDLLKIALAILPTTLFSQKIHVNQAATAGGDGSTWDKAFQQLETALVAAQPGTEIWVAAGTYRNTTAAALNKGFEAKSGVKMYGGFKGTETDLAQRNTAANPTILSGDRFADDTPFNFATNRTDNSLHVLYIFGDVTKTTTIDGFKISGGNTKSATTDPDLDRRGGGILAISPVDVVGCTFSDNFGNSGAGIAILSATASGSRVRHCVFDKNESNGQAAGVFFRQVNSGEVSNCTFKNNKTNRGALYPNYSKSIVVDSCLFEGNDAGANYGGGMFVFQSDLVLKNSIFRKNKAANAAGIYIDGAEETSTQLIDNCVFEENEASGFGGAMFTWQAKYSLKNSTFFKNSANNAGSIYNDGRSQLPAYFTIDNCTFSENKAINFGSGVYNWCAQGELKNSQFFKNDSPGASCVYLSTDTAKQSVFYINKCFFKENTSSGSGGAVYSRTNFQGKTSVGLNGCVFESNAASFGGACVNYSEGTFANFDSCVFKNNAATTSGGAMICGFRANTTLRNSIFSDGNTAKWGGAVFTQNDLTALSINGCTFAGNVCENQGGAINLSGGSQGEIKNSRFSENFANFGGAVNVAEDSLDNSVVNIENVVFTNNFCNVQGAGLNNFNGNVSITNGFFESNQNLGTGAGGAISNNASDGKLASIKATNCTFAYNTATIGAGIAAYQDATSSAWLTLQNSILYHPAATNYEVEDGNPKVFTLGGNLSSDTTMASVLKGTNDLSNVNPQFQDPDNGNFQLKLTSPCIDKGLWAGAPFLDLLGKPRINRPDMGCFENQNVVGTWQPRTRAISLDLMPNPASDFVKTILENDLAGAATADVFSAAGQLVKTFSFEKNVGRQEFLFEVSDLASGAYLLRLRIGSNLFSGAFFQGVHI